MYLPLFPEPVNGKIPSEEFFNAATEITKIFDYFGKMFMPVKYDILGSIDKLLKKFNQDKKSYSSIQSLLIVEKSTLDNKVFIEAFLWLTRVLHMIQLFFEYIVSDFQSGDDSEDLVASLKKAYEITLEPHQGYMAQQLFWLLARRMPTRTEILRVIANGYEVKQEIIIKNMQRFSIRLKENIVILENFYDEYSL